MLLDALAMSANLLLLPKQVSYGMLLPALMIPPAAGVVYLAWSARRSTALLNGSLALGILVILLSVSLMGVSAGGEFQERYLSIMLFVAVAAIIIFNVPAWVSQTISAFGLIFYLMFQLSIPVVSTPAVISAFLFFASGVISMVVARRTMTILAQRSFLLELRNARTLEELARSNALLDELARTDPLTGLANRRHMEEVIGRLLHGKGRPISRLAVLMCDIDHFKALNDTCGHGAGDRALIEVAKALKQSVRSELDLVARYGGEEFIVVLTDVATEEAEKIAERIRQNVEALRLSNQRSTVTHNLTISIGIAVTDDLSYTALEDLTAAADAALYEAKKTGRNRVVAAIR
ncbi:MAG TPA: GGDEF domain-containing protein [Devosia sp.]|uniref:GGDEF domain-containing protein n=1 Tax=Devosia sp. TaxID=1871048 RepID=UPI002F921746